MALRFFFDECTDEKVVHALRAAGVDVVTVTELGRKGLPDEDQLRYAWRENRVLYTVDQDFLRLAAEFQARSEPHAGIAYHLPQRRSRRQIIDALLLMDSLLQSSEMVNRLEYI